MLLLSKCITKHSDVIFCIKCQDEIIPFQKLSDEQFHMTSEKCINKDVNLSNMSFYQIIHSKPTSRISTI